MSYNEFHPATHSQFVDPVPVHSHVPERIIPSDLLRKAQEFSFLFDLMQHTSSEQEVIQTVAKYPQQLHSFILAEDMSLKHDHDHTNVKTKPPLRTEDIPFPEDERLHALYPDGVPQALQIKTAEMNPEKFTLEERENLDLLIALSLKGTAVTIITGKEVMIYPTVRYMKERAEKFVQVANELYSCGYSALHIPLLQDDTEEGQGYRIGTIGSDSKPAIFLLSTGNGGQTFDVFDNFERIDHQPIPDGFYKRMTERGVDELLRDSTADKRKRQLGIIYEDYRKTPEDVQTLYEIIDKNPEDINSRKTLLGDYMNIAPSDAKINWVLDKDKILASPDLIARWKNMTGVDVYNGFSLYEGVKKLFARQFQSEDVTAWPVEVSPAFANGDTFVDITTRGVNKGDSIERIDQYIAQTYKRFGYEVDHLTSVTCGDKPDGNDEKMLVGVPGGVTVSVESDIRKRPQQDNWPVYLNEYLLVDREDDVPDNIELTRQWLYDLLIIRSGRHLRAA